MYSELSDLNSLIAIIDSCQVDMVLKLQSNWHEEDYDEERNLKAKMIKPFLDANREFIVSQSNKSEFLSVLAKYFDSSDYFHYEIKYKENLIGLGYDHCAINFLHPDYFTLSEEHHQILKDCYITFTTEIEGK
ncbi:hypothetical protein [Rufibacter sp. LB8]|nr:hypothetical protein [Rufibacter sp. LB8]